MAHVINFEAGEFRPADCLWLSLIRLRQLQGFGGCHWLFDPVTGTGMVITIWRSAQAEAANRDEAEALTIAVLGELSLMVRGAHTFAVGAQALEPEWSRRPDDRLEYTTTDDAACSGRQELLPELLALVSDCEEFENFQDRVNRW